VECVTVPADLANATVFVYSNLAPPVAVTGNVLQGFSNLPAILTNKPAPVNNWDYGNTTI
jgi:hypothetical protein